MGVATTAAPYGLCTQNPTRTLSHVGVLVGHFLSQNRVSELLTPPLNYVNASKICCIISQAFEEFIFVFLKVIGKQYKINMIAPPPPLDI